MSAIGVAENWQDYMNYEPNMSPETVTQEGDNPQGGVKTLTLGGAIRLGNANAVTNQEEFPTLSGGGWRQVRNGNRLKVNRVEKKSWESINTVGALNLGGINEMTLGGSRE